MIKKELKKARAFVGGDIAGEFSVPVSLSAVALDLGQALIPDEPREQLRKMMQPFSLFIDAVGVGELCGYENIALCLNGLCGACSVYVDHTKVAEWESAPDRVLLPLSKREDFLLEIRFPPRDTPMDVGILGGAELIAFAHDLISDVYTEQLHINEKCELFVRVQTLCRKESEVFATLYSPSGEMHYIGFVHGEGRISFSQVQRFLPAGAGVPGLYRLVITLYHDGTPIDSYETKIGFCKLAFSKGSDGVPFEMMVDDAPFFVKATRVCAHPALHVRDSLRGFAAALPVFAKMGGNTLYATGESGFLSEEVYALCDRLGLFVFQQIPAPANADDPEDYFAHLKAAVSPLSHHPSLALLVLPDSVEADSEIARSIKGFFAFSFPCIHVRKLPAPGFAPIAHLPSMPSSISVRRFLPMEARRIFSYTMESAQDSQSQLISMLGETAKEYPYGASLDDVCYITALSSSDAVENALAAQMRQGALGGWIGGTLFEGGISMQPSLMDALLQRKALYYDLKKTFSPLFLYVKASGQTVDIDLAIAGGEKNVRLVTSLLDRSNRSILKQQDDAYVAAGAALHIKKTVAEVLGHERECYILVSVYEDGALLLEKTALFVPAKHFRFVYPGIQYEIKGSGRNYEITLSASAYVRRLQLSFSKTAAAFDKNYFDITSDGKMLISVETEGVTTSSLLETQLRLRSLYDVGRLTEQDLLDEKDLDA